MTLAATLPAALPFVPGSAPATATTDNTGSATVGTIGTATATGQRAETGAAVASGLGAASVSGTRAPTGSAKATGITGVTVSGSRDITGSVNVPPPFTAPTAQGTPTRFGAISVVGIGDASASGVKLGVLNFEIISADGGIDSAMAASGVFNSFEGG